MHVRDIAHEDDLSVVVLDREGVDPLDDLRAVVHRQQVVLPADLYVA
jgi:hypothetical protein